MGADIQLVTGFFGEFGAQVQRDSADYVSIRTVHSNRSQIIFQSIRLLETIVRQITVTEQHL